MCTTCRMTLRTGPISAGKGKRGGPVYEEEKDAMGLPRVPARTRLE